MQVKNMKKIEMEHKMSNDVKTFRNFFFYKKSKIIHFYMRQSVVALNIEWLLHPHTPPPTPTYKVFLSQKKELTKKLTFIFNKT